MFAVGAWVSRRIADEGDYLIAGRQLGPALVAASVFATWFGAETVLGASGVVYTDGLVGGSADPFGYTLALVGAAVLFAVPLWRMGLTTWADLFRQRYSVGVERLIVLIYVPTSVMWAAAQIRAFGQLVAVVAGVEVSTAITLAAGLAVAYTLLGGLMADAVTDLVQGVALVLGLLVIGAAVMVDAGGFSEGLALVPPERFSPLGSGGRSALEVLEEWAIPVTGSMMTAEILQRMIAARSPGVALWGTLGGAGLYLLFGLVPLYLGLVGPQLVPGLEDPEQLVPTLAARTLHGGAYVVFAGALASMALSTVDSALLSAGGFVSHNLIAPALPGLDERGRLRIARASVLGFGVLATLLALGSASIYSLVETASAFGGSGTFVVSAFAVYTRFGGPWAASSALLAGIGVWVYGDSWAGWSAPYLASLLAALVLYVVVGWWEGRAGGSTAAA